MVIVVPAIVEVVPAIVVAVPVVVVVEVLVWPSTTTKVPTTEPHIVVVGLVVPEALVKVVPIIVLVTTVHPVVLEEWITTIVHALPKVLSKAEAVVESEWGWVVVHSVHTAAHVVIHIWTAHTVPVVVPHHWMVKIAIAASKVVVWHLAVPHVPGRIELIVVVVHHHRVVPW